MERSVTAGKPGFPAPLPCGRARGATLAYARPRAGAWVRGSAARIRRIWGNRVSPYPCLRATPSQTLPGAGAWVRGPPARVR